ncbi:MAG: hypothetical protein NTW10_02425 [Bacteroidetes bacterium]|nr:hypothetical protein [Bacteroidota bacterium]
MTRLAIPIELCTFVLQHRIVNPFLSYVVLKSICAGRIQYNKNQLSRKLRITGKTLDNHLLILRKLNWVGFDPKSKTLFIRGFDKIRQMYQFNSRRAIICTQGDFKTFRAFLFASAVSDILRYKKRLNWQPSATKKGFAKHLGRQPFFHPLAVSYLAKLVHISNTSAGRLKAISEAKGYLTTKENIKATGILSNKIEFYRNPRNENKQYLRKTGATIGVQEPDLISTNLQFTRRKKMVTINKRGIRGE